MPMGGGAASLSSFDARLAKAPYLRNASYWRGQGRAWGQTDGEAKKEDVDVNNDSLVLREILTQTTPVSKCWG